jgi:hypothetical protein
VTAAVAAGISATVFERRGHCHFLAAAEASVSKHFFAVWSFYMVVCWSARTLSEIISRKQRTSTSAANKYQFESAALIADKVAAG